MANICVIGLGIIGLPLALLLVEAKHKVVGVDINVNLIENIINNNKKKDSLEHDIIHEYYGKTFSATNNLHDALLESDVVFITIGTGISDDGSPDLSILYNLFDNICHYPDQMLNKIFVLKSTLPVGTTRNLTKVIENKTGLICGKNFNMVFCPERVLGNKVIDEMKSLPKIIGGMNENGAKRAGKIYSSLGGKIIYVETPEEAELIKLMDNSYRQTLFAFSNDVSLIAKKYNINAYNLIKNANDNYSRNNIPLPSAGVSGYCLTKDPLYLESVFKDISIERGFSSLWYYARKSNDYMPIFTVDLLKNKLKMVDKKPESCNVLVCGITYKEDIDDMRFSHGLEIANILKDEGMNVMIWDPLIIGAKLDFTQISDINSVIMDLDALIFTVKHKVFLKLKENDLISDLLLKMRTPILIDGWGMFQELIGRKDVHYDGIGIP